MVTADILYTYDYEDRQIARYPVTAGSSTTYTVYDGANPRYFVVTDASRLANGGSNASISQRDLYDPAGGQILATDDCSGTAAGVLWGLADEEGTIHDIVDSTGTFSTTFSIPGF